MYTDLWVTDVGHLGARGGWSSIWDLKSPIRQWGAEGVVVTAI